MRSSVRRSTERTRMMGVDAISGSLLKASRSVKGRVRKAAMIARRYKRLLGGKNPPSRPRSYIHERKAIISIYGT